VRVVFDANVVAAAVCWNGEPYLCLVKLARRQAFAYGTAETLEESRAVATELARAKQPSHDAAARLTWYLEKVRMVAPAPLGKQRSRDARDDPYLAAALAAKADCIITFDKDLLVLGKPFGIPILTPAQFLKLLKPQIS
jgi:putative PIN family toxin of toxin-antitoxin system